MVLQVVFYLHLAHEGNVSRVQDTKANGRVEVSLYHFFISALEVSGQLHATAALLLGKVPPRPIKLEARWALEAVGEIWSR